MSLREVLMKKMVSYLKRDNRALRPSRIGGCPRAVVLENISPLPEEETINSKDVARLGSALGGVIYERAIAPFLIDEGFHYQVRVKLDDIEGTCDFYKYVPETEEGIVVDLKTVNRATLPYIPMSGHIDQITIYMECILKGEIWTTKIVDEGGKLVEVTDQRLPNPKKVKGCLIYLLRENPLHITDEQECWIDYDPLRAQILRERFNWLRECIEKEEIPPIPPDYTPFNYPCYIPTYEGIYTCPYWEKCWKDSVVPSDEKTSMELSQLARKYYEAWFAQRLYAKEKDKYSQMLRELTKGIPSLIIPFDGGVLKKTIVSYDDVDYHSVLLGFLDFINEQFKPSLSVRKKMVEVIENLKNKHKRVVTYTRFDVSQGKGGENKEGKGNGKEGKKED